MRFEQFREDQYNQENAAILVKLLTEPRSGSMMQWFIMMAIEEFSERVIEGGANGLENPLMDPQVLLDCAQEAKEAMERWNV